MKRFLYVLMTVAFVVSATGAMAASTQLVDSYRCGSKLFNKGAHDFEVAKSCGEPNSKDVVGYTDHDGMRLKIEKWVYGPTGGKMYVLYFKAGILERIESYRP